MKNLHPIIILCAFLLSGKLIAQPATGTLEYLVYKYAPRLIHDSDENYKMSSVDWYLENSRLIYEEFNVLGQSIEIIEVVSDVTTDEILDWEPMPNTLFAGPYLQGSGTSPGNPNSAKAYVHIQRAYYQDLPYFTDDIEIQYWFFYPWNGGQGVDPFFAHQGDWERVTVIVDGNGELKNIATSAHDGYEYYDPSGVNYVYPSIKQHPIIYVANQSHALYNNTGFNQGSYDKTDGNGYHFNAYDNYEIVEIGNLFAFNEGADKTELINHGIIPTKPFWLNFKGRWGKFNGGVGGPKPWEDRWKGKLTDFGHDYTRNATAPAALITGSSYICSTNNSSYNINTTSPHTVTWSSNNSPYIFPNNSINNTFITHSSNARVSRSLELEAEVTIEYYGYNINHGKIKKDVWLGKPSTVGTNPSGVPAIDISPSQFLTINATATPGSDIYSLNWSKVGSGINFLVGQGNCTVEGIYTSTNYVYVSASNSCGTGWSKQIPVIVSSGGGGGGGQQRLAVMSPNPADSEVTINLTSVFANGKVEKADVFLYNNTYEVVFQTQIEEKTLVIPTTNLIEGLYHLKVFYNDKNFQRHLMIKH